MYTHVMLIWLINVYWMLSLAWQKHWMIEALRNKISIPSTIPFRPSLQCYFENAASIIACFPFFSHSLLYIKIYKISTKLHSSWEFVALWANQI